MNKSEQVLKNLRAHMEGQATKDGFVMVYLDNARHGMNDKEFRACLAQLSKQGKYRVVDAYAWGEVKEFD
jgi:hypothetical protein